MENRFTLKDLFFTLLLVLLLVVVVLAMFQYDRQWRTLKQLERSLAQQASLQAEQADQISAIRTALHSGAFVSQPGATQPTSQPTALANDPGIAAFTSPKGNPFVHVGEAMQQPDYARGDWLVQNFGVKVAKLTPLLSSDTYAAMVQNRVMDSLAYRDPDTLEWVPQLATDWTVSPDGLRIDVTLRKGVQYSDGMPMTADDMVWTIDFIRNPDVDAPRARAGYEPLDHVEKIDDLHVRFVFKRPYFDALTLALSSSPMSKAFYSHYTPQQFNQEVGLLIGTGPYRLMDPTSWRPGTPIQLVRNERYWGPAAPFDRIYWQEVEEEAAMVAMFRNGEIDTFGANPEQFESMRNDPQIQSKANAFQYYFRDGGYTYIAWNEMRDGKATIFADKRVRQALTMLIDRERIARDVYRGYAKPAVGPFGVVSPQNDPSIQPWPYDVRRARELLAEAGFSKRNERGVLVDDQGREFRFKLSYTTKDPLTEQIILQVKDGLARAGIVLEQDPSNWPVIVERLDKRNYDAIILGWTGGIETDIYQMFHSSQIKDGGDNFMSYANPALDAAIEQARQTVDEHARMEIWHRAHQILNDDQPYTFMLVRQALAFVDKRLKNVQPTKSGLNYFPQDTMPIPWYVPRDQQVHRSN